MFLQRSFAKEQAIMSLVKKTFLFILVASLVFTKAQGIQAAEAPTKSFHATTTAQEKHLVLFLLPHFSFNELQLFIDSLPVSIQDRLQFAGMSIRTGGRINLQNNIISLSTGHQELGTIGWSGFQQDEVIDEERMLSAKELYQQRSGRVPEGGILHPDIFQLKLRWKEKGEYETGPGWLGEELLNHQIYTYALGNSDVAKDKNRFAATFTMNKYGEASGIINQDVLSTDPFFPTGQRTDWAMLSTELERIWRNPASFTVIEIGDLKRLESERPSMTTEHYEKLKREWMGQWADFLLNSISQIEKVEIQKNGPEKEVALWILSPMVSDEALRNQKHLLPFISWSVDQSSGLLASETTKQLGVISHLDLVPSILDFFEIKQPFELVGKAVHPNQHSSIIFTEQEGIELNQWLEHLDYIFAIYGTRRPIITAYILIIIFCILASTGYWWFYKRQKGISVVQNVLGTIMLSPVFFLWLTPLIQYVHLSIWISLLLIGALITSWVLYKLCSQEIYLALIGLINSGFILYDILQGSEWMKRSFLGYDPMIGARFYGLGNEYAGILLGSSILAVTSIYVWMTKKRLFEGERGGSRKLGYLLLSSAFYGFILLAMAAPQLGTNAGATLASLGTYLISQWILFQFHFNWKWFLLFLGILVGTLISFGYLHFHHNDTHIGKFIQMIAQGEFVPVIETIERKWEMNLKLIRVSLWGKLFATSLLVLFIFLFRLQRDQLRVSNDWWYNGFRSIVLGAILILLANDSGIVAAATTMLYVTFPFIFLRFSDIENFAHVKSKTVDMI